MNQITQARRRIKTLKRKEFSIALKKMTLAKSPFSVGPFSVFFTAYHSLFLSFPPSFSSILLISPPPLRLSSSTFHPPPPSDPFELTFRHESANKFRGATITYPGRGRGGGKGSKSPDKRTLRANRLVIIEEEEFMWFRNVRLTGSRRYRYRWTG